MSTPVLRVSRISWVSLMIWVVDGLVLLSCFINGYNDSVAVCTKTKYGIKFTSRIGNELEFLDILISFD